MYTGMVLTVTCYAIDQLHLGRKGKNIYNSRD